ncbi:MAG: DUF2752 domain-containing protein [Methylacidiphilales bacterium]|nr:DUF2752 domain-containing protein [Candidatus Methylacidiphilales bacterium]
MQKPFLPLAPDGKTFRLIFLSITSLLALKAWLLPHLPGLPSSDAMRDLVGLPCPFCGGTRAMSCLLHGDWHGALYFNWIVFPVLFLGGPLVAIIIYELASNRRILKWININPRRISVFAAALVLLWGLQIGQALFTPKPELLNPRGLFFQFVSFPEKRYSPVLKQPLPGVAHASSLTQPNSQSR